MLNPSLWNQTKQAISYPELEETISCDICIVGAGLTGISLAYLLNDFKGSVVLVDQKEFAQGASSLNTGKLTAQHGDIYHKLEKMKGLSCAKRYYEHNKRAIEQVEQWKKEGLEFTLTPCFSTLITRKKENQERLKKEYEVYRKLNIPSTTTKQEIPLSSYFSLTMLHQYQLHPVELMNALLKKCDHLQGYQNTRIKEVNYEHPTCLITEKGHKIHAQKVIFCTQAPIVDQSHFFFARYFCLRSYLLLKPFPWKRPFSLISIDDVPLSMRTVEYENQKYLLICDEEHKCGQNKKPRYQTLDMRTKVFSDEILYQWSNQDYNTFDHLPFIGRLLKDKEIYVSFGYNMWGNSWSIASALLLKDAICDQKEEELNDYSLNRTNDIFTLNFIKENSNVLYHWLSSFGYKKQDLHNGSYLMIQGKRYGYYQDHQQIYLVDVTCPHMGCILQYNALEHTWDCPCHASRFSYTGEVINGPATTSLKQNPQQNQIVMPIDTPHS